MPNAKSMSSMKIPNTENKSTLFEEEPCCSGPIEKVGTGISDGVVLGWVIVAMMGSNAVISDGAGAACSVAGIKMDDGAGTITTGGCVGCEGLGLVSKPRVVVMGSELNGMLLVVAIERDVTVVSMELERVVPSVLVVRVVNSVVVPFAVLFRNRFS
jgi:hypothetical protein